jgi:hypothetical protein
MTSMVLRDSTLEFLPLSMNTRLPPILPSWVTYPSLQIESCITSFPFTELSCSLSSRLTYLFRLFKILHFTYKMIDVKI